MIGRGVEECRLWLVQICDRMYLPSCLQVDHLKGVTVDRRREEALALHIDAEMIHASFYVGQRYAGREGQGGALRGGRGLWARCDRHRQSTHCDGDQRRGEPG